LSEPTVDARTVAAKLPHEEDHLRALERMRTLVTYYRWTHDVLRPYIGRRVLDAGCGIGNFTELVARDAERVVAVDLSPQNVEVLRRRFADSPNVVIEQVDLDTHADRLAGHDIDTVVCLDVLEHVEDDLSLLRRFRQIVRPGGHLLIKVPALPWLFGAIDTASGHFRRYTLAELRGKAASAGWKPVLTRYMNIAGVMPYWLKSRVLKRSANFSRTFSPRQLKLIQVSVPVLKAIDRCTGPVAGQSAILVARREDA
jgi:SAM-dependent methyltransferase